MIARDGRGRGGKQMHRAFTHSSYYQLALQEGWGCHGDAEGRAAMGAEQRPGWLRERRTQ